MKTLRDIEVWAGYKKPPNPMKALIITLLWLFVIGWLVLAFSSCTMTVSADGAKSFTLDGEQAIRAIEILNQK